MLWSLFKVLLFVALVVALAFGAQWLLNVSGEVLVTFDGAEYVMPPVVVVLGLLVLLLVFWVVFKLAGLLVATMRFINGDDNAIGRYFDRNRERKGYDALSDSLIALASGEHREATVKAQKAEKYLNRPELTTLLVAQAAEAAGETSIAREAWKELVRRDKTRFVGVRGLLHQKLEEGDTATAMKLAEKAFAIKPGHVATQDTLLEMQARDENWDGARKVLTAKLKSGALPKDVYKRREAVLSLADAREKLAAGATDAARAEAFEANRLSPELVPAAVLAARMHIEIGDKRRAAKVIKAAWTKTHHPDLAAAFADIEPAETPEARIKRFQPLLKLDPTSPETKMLEAELYLAAEDFPAARRALGDLAETNPTARCLTIMAAIERGEGADDRVVRAWLAKAVTAPRGPQWVCDVDGKVYAKWQPITDGGFDTLSWTEPAKDDATATTFPSDMLPLLIGSPDPQAIAPETAPVPTQETANHRINPDVVGTTRDVNEAVIIPVDDAQADGKDSPAPAQDSPRP
ncbi:MAG: heme biosynthesis HemY N-terminal domain-containing protein [Pseudomonadota bacterium]